MDTTLAPAPTHEDEDQRHQARKSPLPAPSPQMSAKKRIEEMERADLAEAERAKRKSDAVVTALAGIAALKHGGAGALAVIAAASEIEIKPGSAAAAAERRIKAAQETMHDLDIGKQHQKKQEFDAGAQLRALAKYLPPVGRGQTMAAAVQLETGKIRHPTPFDDRMGF